MNLNTTYNLIVILGPTATGKTKLAAMLAGEFNGEIISADSRQVYKRMDIGTGKDYNDYFVNGMNIPYHLVDIIEPSDEFNLFLFKSFFVEAFNEITGRKKIPFLTGGTGLYINSVVKDYALAKADFNSGEINELNDMSTDDLRKRLLSLNPALHNTTDLIDKERLIRAVVIQKSGGIENTASEKKINPFIIGINPGREEIKSRITERLKKRLSEGMIEEVEELIKSGISYEKLNFFGLEYKYIGQHLSGELNYNDMFQKLNSAIHSFAKRQMTWFRKMEREGTVIHWLDSPDPAAARELLTGHAGLKV